MENSKRPNKAQRQILKAYGLNVDSFLVIKNCPDYIEVVRRTDLKKYRNDGQKIRTKRISREGVTV